MNSGDGYRPISRLNRCRRYSHGLSQVPALKDHSPKGLQTLLPCPLAGQGVCRYRKPYACSDNIQKASQVVFGHCMVERVRYEVCVKRGLELLGKPTWEEATPEEQAKVASWAESWIYQARVLAYVLMAMAQEVNNPNHRLLGRYQLASCNAEEARYRDLVPEVPPLPGLPEAA